MNIRLKPTPGLCFMASVLGAFFHSLPLLQETLVAFAMSAAAGLAYAAAPPSGLAGLVDYFAASTQKMEHFDCREVKIGRQMGEGNFGVVYEGFFSNGKTGKEQKWERHVVLKRIKPDEDSAQEMQVRLTAAP